MRNVKSDYNKLKEGRGKGEGENYLPWLKVREVPSSGRSHRIYGLKHNRVYHFMSDLEYYYALNLHWQESVTQIREQYPLLPILLTKYIAQKEGIRHPQFKGKYIVMTTDFLIDVHTNEKTKGVVRSVKYSQDIENISKNRRTLEKLYLERLFFKYHDSNIDWAVVTEKEINIIRAKNIDFFYQDRYWVNRSNVQLDLLRSMIFNFFNVLSANNKDIVASIKIFSELCNFESVQAIPFIKYLIANKMLKIEMSEKVIRTISDIKIVGEVI